MAILLTSRPSLQVGIVRLLDCSHQTGVETHMKGWGWTSELGYTLGGVMALAWHRVRLYSSSCFTQNVCFPFPAHKTLLQCALFSFSQIPAANHWRSNAHSCCVVNCESNSLCWFDMLQKSTVLQNVRRHVAPSSGGTASHQLILGTDVQPAAASYREELQYSITRPSYCVLRLGTKE